MRWFIVILTGFSAAVTAAIVTKRQAASGGAGTTTPPADPTPAKPAPPPLPEPADQATAPELLPVVRGARGRFTRRPPLPAESAAAN